MKSKTTQIAITVILLTMAVVAQEKAVKMKDLPPAVQAAVKEQSQGAKLRGLAMEIENGKTFYEAELLVNGHNKDVLMDAEGKIVEIEEQVALDTLPAAAKNEIVKQAGKAKIVMVESVIKEGAIVFYEAHVKKGLRTVEIKVSPDGQVVKEK